jgi:hypothetical protein
MFLRLLQPVASTLTGTDLNISLHDDEEFIRYLKYVLPSDGFKDFKCLERLHIPYQVPFGTADPQWSHIAAAPPDLLPSTIQVLEIGCPSIEIYEWFERFSHYREQLPALSNITLMCSSTFGDSYEKFDFTLNPHPASAVLQSMNVKLNLKHRRSGRE